MRRIFGSLPESPVPLGLRIIHTPPNTEITVDIVAVHGLDGHPIESWTKGDVFWLRDCLPTSFESARVMSYGYTGYSYSHGEYRVQKDTIFGYARGLVQELNQERQNVEKRPIVFIAHSLGGLVVKEALIYSNSRTRDDQPELRSIRLSTCGILFFGTPHRGSDAGATLVPLILNVMSIYTRTDSKLVDSLRPQAEAIQSQLDYYIPISEDFKTVCFYERKETPIKIGIKKMIVPQLSATLGTRGVIPVGFDSDHINMVKFTGLDDPQYSRVRFYVTQCLMEEQTQKINGRWESEQRTLTSS